MRTFFFKKTGVAESDCEHFFKNGQSESQQPARLLSVRLSTPCRHPKTSGFDVAEGRI